MNKRALLILIGGRQVPNVLTAQYLRPEIIVPIASHEAMQPGREWEKVKPILKQLCPNGLREPVVVDAYNRSATYLACLQALLEQQNAEWVINVTCGSKIMGFGAYDAAVSMNWPMPISIWYLDTATQRVVELKGGKPESDLFHLTVEDYFTAYGRQTKGANPTDEEVAFARLMAQSPRDAMKLAKGMRNAELKDGRRVLLAPQKNLDTLMKAAQSAGFIHSFKLGAQANRPGYSQINECEIEEATGKSLFEFTTGDWLEVYAWWAAKEAGSFDDYRYGVKIQNEGAGNELDLAATRAAALLIAECKTDDSSFKNIKEKKYIEKLHSIADMVGGNFVARLLVLSQTVPQDPDGQKSYQSFCEQARARQVVVVTGEQLKDLPDILRRESGATPTYSRI